MQFSKRVKPMKPMTTTRRITIRLSPEDETIFQSIRKLLLTRFPNLTDTEVVRAALREAERALKAVREMIIAATHSAPLPRSQWADSLHV
jgi:hypothetical protein